MDLTVSGCADVVPTADALRAQQLEDNLAKMTVALDEANGRISQLQAASTATAPTAAPSALRGDSVLSLEAQTKALGAGFCNCSSSLFN